MEFYINLYLEEIKLLLDKHPVVSSFEVIRERISLEDGFIQIQCSIFNGYTFHIFEFIKNKDVIDYRYQLLDKQNHNIVRWDNAPHHRQLDTFPHHRHEKNIVLPNNQPNLREILNLITNYF